MHAYTLTYVKFTSNKHFPNFIIVHHWIEPGLLTFNNVTTQPFLFLFLCVAMFILRI